MATANGLVRTRRKAVLPSKIEAAYQVSESKRGPNKTSRLDYAAGYEDGYRDALEALMLKAKLLNKELLKP